MVHLNDVFKKDLPIWSSSPGLPWINHGYAKKRDIQRDPDAIKRVRWFWHRIKQGEEVRLPDCCAYVRAHIVRRGETKVRAVWGYPATVSFGEAVFALPLIEAYKKGKHPIAYGYETGRAGCKKLTHEFKGRNFLGIDFKNFDKTLPPWLIHIAFDVLASNINFGYYAEYGTARVKAMLRMFYILRDYCIDTRIRICNGERYLKDWGLASGSYFTQLVGSICNYLLLTYAALQAEVEITNIKVFGDDSLMATSSRLTPDDIATILAPLGMVVNVQKSGFSAYLSRLTFLGYQINSGIPLRSREKAFAALVFPERPDKGWDFVASRAVGLNYANFGVDPIVDFWTREVVNFKHFDLILSRDQQRFMTMLGVDCVSASLPTMFDYAHRLGYL